DDRGEYRIFYLSHGRYFLSAGNQTSRSNVVSGLPPELALAGAMAYVTPNRVTENYAIRYFPGVSDENSATALDIPPGADLAGAASTAAAGSCNDDAGAAKRIFRIAVVGTEGSPKSFRSG